jgi:hypothetical protein
MQTSPGGSMIRRYASWLAPKLGPSEEPVAEYAALRERVYGELFGEVQEVYTEPGAFVPHIEVRKYHRMWTAKKTTVLVTSGMSDARMKLSRVAKGISSRAELIFYCSDPCDNYVETLRQLARFPHDNRSWLYFGHTIPNGDPPAPFWGSKILNTALFSPTVVKRDQALPEKLILGGDPVNFLWVVPVSSAECELKLQNGFPAVLELFNTHQHPFVFDPARPSYV